MKLLILATIFLALTGCVSKDNKPKVYRTKIEFYKPEKLKVLYSMPEEKNLPEECYKINFPDTAIAKMMLNTHKLRKINANTKKMILHARREIKKGEAELARRKDEIAKTKKQIQKIKDMRQELKEIEVHIEKVKKKRQEEKERRLRS